MQPVLFDSSIYISALLNHAVREGERLSCTENQTFNGANIFSPVRVDASDAEWDAALLQVVTLPHFLRLSFSLPRDRCSWE